MSEPNPTCKLCGEPMPEGEEVFFYHGYSGPCPKPPLPKNVSQRPSGSNADEWHVFLVEHIDALPYVAVQIAEAIESSGHPTDAKALVTDEMIDERLVKFRRIWHREGDRNALEAVLRSEFNEIASLRARLRELGDE